MWFVILNRVTCLSLRSSPVRVTLPRLCFVFVSSGKSCSGRLTSTSMKSSNIWEKWRVHRGSDSLVLMFVIMSCIPGCCVSIGTVTNPQCVRIHWWHGYECSEDIEWLFNDLLDYWVIDLVLVFDLPKILIGKGHCPFYQNWFASALHVKSYSVSQVLRVLPCLMAVQCLTLQFRDREMFASRQSHDIQTNVSQTE